MDKTVYVETSIPSFYFESRTGSQMQARREWTREWWELAMWQDALVTSAVVIAELKETEHIRMVNGALGLHTPQLVTPFELLEAMS